MLLLLVLLTGCGTETVKGAPNAMLAAQNYVTALGDRDFDRSRALRWPEQFRRIAFNTAYFTEERIRLGLENQPNPTFAQVGIADAGGNPLPTNAQPIGPTAHFTLTISAGPTLTITAATVDGVWYISETGRLPLPHLRTETSFVWNADCRYVTQRPSQRYQQQ